MNIEITNICNLQCSFCPEVVRAKKQMPLELFETVLDQVAPLTNTVALHLMGDPLVHAQLDKFVEACHQRELQVFLVTNGVLLREKEKQILLHPAIRQVSFSLHSFIDNFPGRDPGVYLDRIFEFTELAFEKSPKLFINYRLWNQTAAGTIHEQNEDLLQRIELRFGIKIDRNRHAASQKGFKIQNRLSLHFDTRFVWPALDLPIISTRGTCQALKSHFGVLVDGTVVPCCLDKEGAIALGNIGETPLSQILSNPKARSLLQGFRKRELIDPLCQRCNYIERFAV